MAQPVMAQLSNMYINSNSVKGSHWNTVTASNGTITKNVYKIYNTSSTTTSIANQPIMVTNQYQAWQYLDDVRTGKITIEPGYEAFIELPDGATLHVLPDGSYVIKDANAKVTYKANRVREFNRYVNASDLLEEFIDFVDGVGGIDKDAFMALPVESFIRWLVLRAAQADGEDEPGDAEAVKAHIAPPAALPAPSKAIARNCRCCGRFVSRKRADHGMRFCSAEHFAAFETKIF